MMKKQLFLMGVLTLLTSFVGRAHDEYDMAQSEKKEKVIKVACIGDSITYGFGVEEREENSYPAQLQRMLGPAYLVGNFGKSNMGLLSKGPLPYIKEPEWQAALDFKGDIAVIHLGVNDVDPMSWPCYKDEFVSDYLALIDAVRTANPACRVLIARLTPIGVQNRRFEMGSRDWLAEIQEAVDLVAELAEVQLIDFREPIYQYPTMMPDQLHPNAEGYGLLAKTVYEGITGNFGGLEMASIYSSNMVLQHGQQLIIRGKADAGEQVRLNLKVTGQVGSPVGTDGIVLPDGTHLATGKGGSQRGRAMAGLDGRWEIVLDPLRAGERYEMQVSTKNRSLVYENVVAGEVWLCSGQSNMQFRLEEASTAEEDIPSAENELLRLYDMKPCKGVLEWGWSKETLEALNHNQYYAPASWKECEPKNAAVFSAVAYYFGQKLQHELGIPVGLICNAIGGSTTESWVDRASLELEFPGILKNWWENNYVYDIMRNQAKRDCKNAGTLYQRHPYQPYFAYDAGIRPLLGYAVKGVIWYQGESNVNNTSTHEKLFRLLVEGWRKSFGQSDLPFYFVQISGMDRPLWPWFRDSQRRLAEELDQVGMVVSSDYGDSLNVHPRVKKPIGERLARLALHKTYGLDEVVPCGPMFRAVRYARGRAFVSFNYGQGLKASSGKEIIGFEVAGKDLKFYPAQVEVVKEAGGEDQLAVWSGQVKEPLYVRYAWQPFTRANLVNGADFPASTFFSR